MSPVSPCPDDAALRGTNLSAAGFLDPEAFRAVLDTCGVPAETGRRYGADEARGALVAALAFSECDVPVPGWAREGAGAGPEAAVRCRIARFARTDWYAELRSRMRAIALRLEGVMPPGLRSPSVAVFSRRWKFLSNSGLPERELARAAGLGRIGRNGLLMIERTGSPGSVGAVPGGAPRVPGRVGDGRTPGRDRDAAAALADSFTDHAARGPGVVLGLCLLPFDPGLLAGFAAVEGGEDSPPPCPPSREDGDDIPGVRSIVAKEDAPGRFPSACDGCRACVDACPTGALGGDGSFLRERCIQHWTATDAEPPGPVREAWGDTLYGCDRCLESCPRFSRRTLHGAGEEDPPSRGLLGPWLPAGWLLGASDAEIRARLKGTVLGMSWMQPAAFRRNARFAVIAAGRGRGGAP